MKRRLMGALILGTVFIAAPLWATEAKQLFLERCGGCHRNGGSAAAVNPGDKAGRVWEKYFARGRHPVETGIADADLQSIIAYLQAHAADSDQPATAVIPK